MSQLCECGCGAATSLAKVTNAKHGHVKGQPVRFLPGHGRRKEAQDVSSRFFQRVDKTDGCWLWTGRKNTKGYGRLTIDGRTTGAHRWSYEYHVGPIPEGLVIDHLCRNRGCVNPDHLEPVTQKENVRRGEAGQRTHCYAGHEFTPENTIMRTSPSVSHPYRVCKTCRQATQRAWRARRRGVDAADLTAQLRATTAADQARWLADALKAAK
jgi:hypothetical protein